MEIIKNKNVSKHVGVRFHPDPLKQLLYVRARMDAPTRQI